MWKKIKDNKKRILAVMAVCVIVWVSIRPSNDRDWAKDQALLAYATIDGNTVNMYNIRNCSYRTQSDFDVHHYDRQFNLDELSSLDFIIEPFGLLGGTAHTFLSFGFKDGQYLAVSVEIRREKGEEFSIAKGLFKQFELMYVVGDERDLIGLRAKFRQADVFLYPIKTNQEGLRDMFLDVLKELNTLKDKPRFYNTFTNNCTSNIASHVDHVMQEDAPFRWQLIMTGYSDGLAYDLGLIDTDLSFAEARKQFQINDLVDECKDDENFSKKIRQRHKQRK